MLFHSASFQESNKALLQIDFIYLVLRSLTLRHIQR